MSQPETLIAEHIQSLKPVPVDMALIERMMRLIDLTSLNDTDTEASIALVCEKATNTTIGYPAAVCFYAPFVRLAVAQFAKTPVQVATVVNFPSGQDDLESSLIQINSALEDGAQEIDLVFPYTRYLAGDKEEAVRFVSACKAACGEDVKLKVILETGALKQALVIANASRDVLRAGADFIKTSTGKIPEGATLEAAATMLLVIKELTPELQRPLGLKISGGIREIEQAASYMELADRIMGKAWISPNTFRIGASKLVDELTTRAR